MLWSLAGAIIAGTLGMIYAERRQRRHRPPITRPHVLDHSVELHYALSDSEFGRDDERRAVFEFESRLEEAIAANQSGELDGNEFGGGEVVVFLNGADKDRLWHDVEPEARRFSLRPAYAIVRGSHSEPERIDL